MTMNMSGSAGASTTRLRCTNGYSTCTGTANIQITACPSGYTGAANPSDSSHYYCKSTATACPANATKSGSTCACNAGYEQQGSGTTATCQPANAKQAGIPSDDPHSCSTKPSSRNPIAFGTGNKTLVESDYASSGVSPLNVVRTYNSAASNRLAYDMTQKWSINVRRGFSFNYPNPTVALAYRPDGKVLQFTLSGSAWVPDADIADKLVQLKSGSTTTGWRYFVAADNSVEEYDANGLLLQITAENGLLQQFSFSDGSGGILYGTTPQANGYLAPACNRPSGFSTPSTAGVLLCVTDSQARQLNFSYNGAGQLDKFADPLLQITQYSFDGAGNLSTVTYPDTKVRTYLYNESGHNGGVSQPNILTGITDENNNRYATYDYNSTGKAVGETLALGADATSLSFSTGSTMVTDALGTARTYSFSTVLGVQLSTGSSQPAGMGRAIRLG